MFGLYVAGNAKPCATGMVLLNHPRLSGRCSLLQSLPVLSDCSKLLDLSQVAPNERTTVWKRQVETIFPGMSVDHMPDVTQGEIQLVRMGPGTLCSVRSSAATVRYRPARSARPAQVSLMLQTEGGTRLMQRDRSCDVLEGEIGLLDEAEPFVLSGSNVSQLVFLRMPRAVVACRHPYLMKRMAVAWEPQHAGAGLVRAALVSIMAALPHLTERQRSSALASFVHMLGVLEPDPVESASGWRVKAALDLIEAHFSNPELSAGDVALAQRISRRRLDSMLVAATGLSITAHIWNRRLQQAAQDLSDPRYSEWNVSSIGYANGFSHPAHFTRAFKARYGTTPRQYRQVL